MIIRVSRVTCALVLGSCLVNEAAQAALFFNVTTQDADSMCLSSFSSASPFSTTVPCSYTGGLLLSSMTGSLAASANYTSLSGFVQFDAVTTGRGAIRGFFGVGVQSANGDDLMVLGGVGSGLLRATYLLSGTDTTNALSVAVSQLFVQGPPGSFFLTGPGTLTIDIPFTFGVPFVLQAALNVGNGSDSQVLLPFTGLSGTSDYTASLLPFQVLDVNGQRIVGATVRSPTFTYDVDPASGIPEGGTGTMFVVSMAGLLGAALWRRKGVLALSKQPTPAR